MTQISLAIAVLFLLAVPITEQPSSTSNFVLPPGFTITEVAGPELANDIYCMTFSPEGHLVVSGRRYLKQLVDDNSDGQFDRAILLADHPKDGSMGLMIEGDTFYFMGDGGLRRMTWKPGHFANKSELLIKLKTGGEHDAHAISRGPDGWLYLLCGNTSNVNEKHASLDSSPIKKLTAGCVLRVSPEFKSSEIICDGFRNAYGFDWSLDGELYTYDSDNERCLGLPWYEGCRFYRIERGGHYGWRSPQKAQFWRMPPYHPDIVAPVADLGRGSPTGVACYRHQQFPKEYHGAFFLLDWTFGIIHCVQLDEKTPRSSVFLKVIGGHGFAPTAAAIHPKTGDLFVTSGGRGTRGSIYRIRHEESFNKLPVNAQSRPPANSASSVTLHQPRRPVISDKDALLKQFQSSGTSQERLRTLCQLMSQFGEVGTKSSDYAFKEGYQLIQQPSDQQPFVQGLLHELRGAFPSQDTAVNRELSRALALLKDESTETIEKLLAQITNTSSPIDDVHYLFVVACCPAKRTTSQTKAIAQALIRLDAKYEAAKLIRERHWAMRMAEAVRALVDLDPALPAAIMQQPDLGRPGHLLFSQDKRFPLDQMAKLWLARLKGDSDYPWSAELVTLLSHGSSRDFFPLLRARWDDPILRDAILPVLANAPEEQDRQRFITSVRSISSRSVKLALEALNQLPVPTTTQLTDEMLACTRAVQYWFKLDERVAEQLQSRLCKLTRSTEKRDPKAWQAWMIDHYPGMKTQLESSDGVDRTKWNERLKKIDWTSGRLAQGEVIYKQHCAACHQGTSALGPDLAGIGKRFSHDDLMTAILQPSKDVPARYRTSVYTTHSGQTHSGLVIYEAIDGIILQTATSTIRIPGNDIAGTRTSEQSLMPAGLLDTLTDQQIADLLAWLKR